MTSDYNWKYDFAEINKIDDKTYEYKVFGELHWYFLGLKLFSENKEIRGTFKLESKA